VPDFDALRSKRVYKDEWRLDAVLTEIRAQRGPRVRSKARRALLIDAEDMESERMQERESELEPQKSPRYGAHRATRPGALNLVTAQQNPVELPKPNKGPSVLTGWRPARDWGGLGS
jgi:hypothetical protein